MDSIGDYESSDPGSIPGVPANIIMTREEIKAKICSLIGKISQDDGFAYDEVDIADELDLDLELVCELLDEISYEKF
jgi:hypothetical protein